MPLLALAVLLVGVWMILTATVVVTTTLTLIFGIAVTALVLFDVTAPYRR